MNSATFLRSATSATGRVKSITADSLSCGSATGEVAAIDAEGDASNEAGLVGGKVDRRAGDILRIAEPSKRDTADEPRSRFLLGGARPRDESVYERCLRPGGTE